MNILWVATKAPWPPVDGGRLLLWNTLGALRDAGHRVTLVAPVDPGAFDLDSVRAALMSRCEPELVSSRPRPVWRDVARSLLRGVPLTIARHERSSVRRRVADLLAEDRHDFVQVEQLQALPQVPPDLERVVVLRAQNVESDLWHATADSPSLRWRWLRSPLLRLEAARLARWESRALLATDGVVSLTHDDAARLTKLEPRSTIRVAPAPFEVELPAASRSHAGAPAVLLLGSAGWLPNLDGARWFLEQVWPRLHGSEPNARLHVFGLDLSATTKQSAGVSFHPRLESSRDAFAPGSILVVPLSVASGVRMKIIEAWARGIPVVATRAAAGGLEAKWGQDLLVCESAEAMAEAVVALDRDPDRMAGLIAAGRACLRRAYSSEVSVAALESAWSSFGLGGTSPSAEDSMNSA